MKTRDLKKGGQLIHLLGGRSNVYLLNNGEDFILIDNGRRQEKRLLLTNLLEIIGEWNNLKYIILTHTHFDHCSNTTDIKERSGAQILLHQKESEQLKKGFTPIPKGTIFLTKLLSLVPRPITNKIGSYPPAQPDIEISETYALPEEKWDILVMPTPGHTEGSVSIIVNDEVALVGDLLFGIQKQNIFPPFANDVPRLLKSWEMLLETRCEWFFPGHGRPVTRKRLEKELEKLKEIQK